MSIGGEDVRDGEEFRCLELSSGRTARANSQRTPRTLTPALSLQELSRSNGSGPLPPQHTNNIDNNKLYIEELEVTYHQGVPASKNDDLHNHVHRGNRKDPATFDQRSQSNLAASASNTNPPASSLLNPKDTSLAVLKSNATPSLLLPTEVTMQEMPATGCRPHEQPVTAAEPQPFSSQNAADPLSGAHSQDIESQAHVRQAATESANPARANTATVEDNTDVALRKHVVLPVRPADGEPDLISRADVSGTHAAQVPDQQAAPPLPPVIPIAANAGQAEQTEQAYQRWQKLRCFDGYVVFSIAFLAILALVIVHQTGCIPNEDPKFKPTLQCGWTQASKALLTDGYAQIIDWSSLVSGAAPLCSCEETFPEPLRVCMNRQNCQELPWTLQIQKDADQTCRHIGDRYNTFRTATAFRQHGFSPAESDKINASITAIYAPVKAISAHAQIANSLWISTQDHFLHVIRRSYSLEYEREKCPSCSSLQTGEMPITVLLGTVRDVSHIFFDYIIDPVFKDMLRDASAILIAKKNATSIWEANRHQQDHSPSVKCFLYTLEVGSRGVDFKFRCSTNDLIENESREQRVYEHWSEQHTSAVRRGKNIMDTLHRSIEAMWSAHGRLEHLWKKVLQPFADEQEAALARAQQEERLFLPAHLVPWSEPGMDAAQLEWIPAMEFLRRVAGIALAGSQIVMATAVGLEMRSLNETLLSK